MITAKEARQIVESLDTEKGRQEKKTVEEKINAAINRGENFCWLGIWISGSAEKWLKNLGYNVERYDSQRDCSDVKVTW